MSAAAELVARLAGGDTTFAVTGASGWFGMATLDLLVQALGRDGLVERVTAYASRTRDLTLSDGTRMQARPLAELRPADHTLHYAYLTPDRAADPGYVADNLQITAQVLGALPVRGLLYLSSGAVYAPGGLVENAYGALKRIDELSFRQACRDAGARCAVARVFNVSGPHMTKPRQYALGDLVARVRAGEPLEIRSARPVRRSYALAADIVAVGLGWLLEEDTPGEVVFDTAGDEVVEVEELAHRVAAVLGRPDLPVRRPSLDLGAAPDAYVGDGDKMRRLAGRLGIPLASLDEQILATAAF